MRSPFAIAAAVLALCSCSGPQAVLLLDPYLDRFRTEAPVSALWTQAASERGWRTEIFQLPPGAFPQDAIKVLEKKNPLPEAVFVTALYSGAFLQALRSAFPTLKIVVLFGDPASASRSTWVLEDERGPALKEVGERTALYVRDQHPSADLGAGAVFYSRTPERAAEREAFLEGWNKVMPPEKLLIQELYQLRDIETLRRLLQTISGQNPPVYALFASSMNPVAFPLLESAECLLVTEDWESSRPMPSRVLFSIEKDWAAGLAAAFDDLALQGGRVLPVRARIFQNENFQFPVKNAVPSVR